MQESSNLKYPNNSICEKTFNITEYHDKEKNDESQEVLYEISLEKREILPEYFVYLNQSNNQYKELENIFIKNDSSLPETLCHTDIKFKVIESN